MNYPRYLKLLDAFGVAALVSAWLYVALPEAQRPTEPHIDSLWGNLSTEMIGIWIGVRIIDWIIRSHESSTKGRVRIVRNMRLMENLFHQVLDFRRPYHLIQLHRELDWVTKRLAERFRHLDAGERGDVEAFYANVGALIARLPSRAAAVAASERQRVDLEDLPSLYEALERIEASRHRAEKNILAETNEDDGL